MTRNSVIMLLIILLVAIATAGLLVAKAIAGVGNTVYQAPGKVTMSSLSLDRASVRPGEVIHLRATAADKVGSDLLYIWKAYTDSF